MAAQTAQTTPGTSTITGDPHSGPPPTRRQQQARATKERIADSALRLFAEQGYAATSTRQIAQAAGVSEGLIFRHFPSKLELLRNVSAHRRTFRAEVLVLLEDASELPAAVCLRTLGDGFVDLVRQESMLLNVLLGESRTNHELYEMFRTVVDETTTVISTYLEQRIAAGELRADLPQRGAVHAFLGPLFLFFLTNKHLSDEEWATRSRVCVTELLDMWFAGARPQATPTPARKG